MKMVCYCVCLWLLVEDLDLVFTIKTLVLSKLPDAIRITNRENVFQWEQVPTRAWFIAL